MSKPVNTTAIGIFIVGAIGLAMIAIMVFGFGALFHTKENYVVFFSGSINGLNVGAPVKFRGVTVGEVKKIYLDVDVASDQIKVDVPIIIEVNADKFQYVGKPDKQTKKRFQALVKHGIRAELKMQSLITGQLYVEINFHPDTPIRLVTNNTKYFQIPTLPSSSEDIGKALKSANKLMKTLTDFVQSPNLSRAIKKFGLTMDSSNRTIKNINNYVEPISTRLEHTLKNLDETLMHVKTFADYLSRHPEALLFGKGDVKKPWGRR